MSRADATGMAMPQPDRIGNVVSSAPAPGSPVSAAALRPAFPLTDARANCALRAVAQTEVDLVTAAFGSGRGGRALDIGPANGIYARALRASGWQVDACPGAPTLLAPTQLAPTQLAPSETANPGAARLGFADASFDAVVAMRAVKFVLDTEEVLTELSRVLAPGGTMVFDLCNGRSIARLGHPAGKIGFITMSSIPSLLGRAGLVAVSIVPGPRLPHPLYLRAKGPRAARVLHRAEQLAQRMFPHGAGARSFIITAVRCR